MPAGRPSPSARISRAGTAAADPAFLSSGSPDAEAEARRLGVDAFVPKPVPLWELARLVQGWAVS